MADSKQLFVVEEPYLDISCSLGEGPFWEEKTRTLRFVDIEKNEIHTVQPDQGPGSHSVLKKLDISIGHTADIDGYDDGFAFGGKGGFGIFDRKSLSYEYIARFWEGRDDAATQDREMRSNDGGVDSHGRYLIGVMNDSLVKEPGPCGTIFRLDPDRSLHRLIEGVTIPNGISWSLNGRILYLADSPTKTIYEYDYDPETGDVGSRRDFFTVEDEHGVPDGQAIDEEGYMWTAVFGTGKVLRISPSGRVVAEIQLPTRCVTCPVFVDDWLYITTAKEEDPDRFPDSIKFQGAVFRLQVGVLGAPVSKFRLK